MTENFRNSFLKINSMQNQCLVSHILLALLFQVRLFGSKTNLFFLTQRPPAYLFFFLLFFFLPPALVFSTGSWGWVLGVACLEQVKTTVAVLWPQWPGAACCPRPCHPPCPSLCSRCLCPLCRWLGSVFLVTLLQSPCSCCDAASPRGSCTRREPETSHLVWCGERGREKLRCHFGSWITAVVLCDLDLKIHSNLIQWILPNLEYLSSNRSFEI